MWPGTKIKGVLLCFFSFWILVSVQCVCLCIKISTKLQISKSTPKGDISFLENPFSRTTTNGSFGLQRCFQVFVISQSGPLEYHQNKSRVRKFEWLGRGEVVVRTLGWVLQTRRWWRRSAAVESSFHHVEETLFFLPPAQTYFSFLKQTTSGNSDCNLFLTLFLSIITPITVYRYCVLHILLRTASTTRGRTSAGFT